MSITSGCYEDTSWTDFDAANWEPVADCSCHWLCAACEVTESWFTPEDYFTTPQQSSNHYDECLACRKDAFSLVKTDGAAGRCDFDTASATCPVVRGNRKISWADLRDAAAYAYDVDGSLESRGWTRLMMFDQYVDNSFMCDLLDTSSLIDPKSVAIQMLDAVGIEFSWPIEKALDLALLALSLVSSPCVEACKFALSYIDADDNTASASFFEKDGVVVLAFRGSDGLLDWTNNLNFADEYMTDLHNNEVEVHSGFYEYMAELAPKVNKYKDWLANDCGIEIDFITGHSLGGAATTLYADKYGEPKGFGGDGSFGVVTFGAPATHNYEWLRRQRRLSFEIEDLDCDVSSTDCVACLDERWRQLQVQGMRFYNMNDIVQSEFTFYEHIISHYQTSDCSEVECSSNLFSDQSCHKLESGYDWVDDTKMDVDEHLTSNEGGDGWFNWGDDGTDDYDDERLSWGDDGTDDYDDETDGETPRPTRKPTLRPASGPALPLTRKPTPRPIQRPTRKPTPRPISGPALPPTEKQQSDSKSSGNNPSSVMMYVIAAAAATAILLSAMAVCFCCNKSKQKSIEKPTPIASAVSLSKDTNSPQEPKRERGAPAPPAEATMMPA